MSSLQVPLNGSTFAGRYRVEGLLGEGGMGVVLRATELANGRPVALKVLSGEAAAAPEAVARFRQEARIASRIRNVHVVSVLDFGEDEGGRQFIAMELLDGIDLDTLVAQRGHLPTEEAVALVLQGCAGVAAAHAQGLIHRDLKPANLFLARREGLPPVVKVLDFGLSKSLDTKAVRLTQTAMAMGTPMYMAPEQITSTKHVDARCDQHAMAMVLYELITGHPPYEAPSATALAVAIATHPPPSARDLQPGVPALLDAAIQRGLAKRPDDRFDDLGQLALAIVPFAPTGGRVFAQMIEATLAPLRAPDMEHAPTVQMSLPASLLPDKALRRSGRARQPGVTSGDAATPPLPVAQPMSAERAAAIVTASPVSTDPRAKALAPVPRNQTALLLGGAIVGVAVVGALTFAVISRRGPDGPSIDEAGATGAATTSLPAPATSPAATVAPAVEPREREPAEPAASVGTSGPARSASASSTPSAHAPKKPRAPKTPPKKSDPLLKYD